MLQTLSVKEFLLANLGREPALRGEGSPQSLGPLQRGQNLALWPCVGRGGVKEPTQAGADWLHEKSLPCINNC